MAKAKNDLKEKRQMKYLDPKADLTFKKIFGKHPDLLMSLLNALLPLSDDEQIQSVEENPEINKALEELKVTAFTEEELRAYDKFWDNVMVEKTLQYDSFHKGKAEGIEEGMEKGFLKGDSDRGLADAKRFLAMGLSPEQVAQGTQLPLNTILALLARHDF